MSNLTRPIIFYKRLDNALIDGKWVQRKEAVGNAVFHKWSMGFEELEVGTGNYATAIIELTDGTVQNIEAELIRFVDQNNYVDN